MDRPMTFLQGITLATASIPAPTCAAWRVLRDKKIAPVDVYSLMVGGSIEQNFWLRPGDTIFLPDNRNQNVFVFGAVNQAGPDPDTAGPHEPAGGDRRRRPPKVGTKLEHVRIIRSLTTTTGELLVVDVAAIPPRRSALHATGGGRRGLRSQERLRHLERRHRRDPSLLTAVGAILNPFVQIKFLSSNQRRPDEQPPAPSPAPTVRDRRGPPLDYLNVLLRRRRIFLLAFLAVFLESGSTLSPCSRSTRRAPPVRQGRKIGEGRDPGRPGDA